MAIGAAAFAAFIGSAALPAQDLGAAEIVARMDASMNFDECRMNIVIDDVKPDGKTRSLEAAVEYKKGTGTRIEFLAPAREKGKRILMTGSSTWMASPAVSKPVRLSGKDSFMGTSFTNDDVMNLDKGDDYASIIESSSASSWTIVMTALKSDLPYPKLVAVVGKDFLPIEMTYFARSGKESKRVSFSEPKAYGTKRRPSKMTIVDLMKPGDSSCVTFVSIDEGAIDASRFTPASIGY
jgi:outer membrane lipoprotein-sorting protein